MCRYEVLGLILLLLVGVGLKLDRYALAVEAPVAHQALLAIEARLQSQPQLRVQQRASTRNGSFRILQIEASGCIGNLQIADLSAGSDYLSAWLEWQKGSGKSLFYIHKSKTHQEPPWARFYWHALVRQLQPGSSQALDRLWGVAMPGSCRVSWQSVLRDAGLVTSSLTSLD